MDSKILNLVYSPLILTMSKIHRKIAAVGHDTELEKAKDVVYTQLPSCCHYREIDRMAEETKKKAPDLKADSIIAKAIPDSLTNQTARGPHVIKGVVLEEDKKGSFKPLVAASYFAGWFPAHKASAIDPVVIIRGK